MAGGQKKKQHRPEKKHLSLRDIRSNRLNISLEEVVERLTEIINNDLEKNPPELEFTCTERNAAGSFTTLGIEAPEFYNGETIKILFPYLRGHSQLKYVSLSFISDLTDEASPIFDVLASLQNVVSLTLASPIDDEIHLKSLAAAITKMKSLKEVTITNRIERIILAEAREVFAECGHVAISFPNYEVDDSDDEVNAESWSRASHRLAFGPMQVNVLFATLLLGLQRLETDGVLPPAHHSMLEDMLEGWTWGDTKLCSREQ